MDLEITFEIAFGIFVFALLLLVNHYRGVIYDLEHKKECDHDWVVTGIEQEEMSPAFKIQSQTHVARVCKKCQVQETHSVSGKIDIHKARVIYELK